VSLNFRDILIAKGTFPFAVTNGVIPTSDGAGTVVAIGSKVSLFEVGDKVATLFSQGHLAGSLTPTTIAAGLGGARDGALREYGAFNEHGLVKTPSNLTALEASTLPCAALTAWNALYGLRPLRPGQTVLTQGTGGVSIFALQFAKAAGAKVVATTSSDDKADILKKLGADVVINYKNNPNWGTTAKRYTTDGFDFIIEVGGPSTMRQSLNAIKIDGIISVIGFLGGASAEEQPSTLEALSTVSTIRGVFVGSRQQFEDMNQAIKVANIKPVIDETIFSFDQVKEAYQFLSDQKHFGKLCVKFY
jgi:NADPH:quinone reductase-like Zn-dependent oxidoreductase